MIIFRWIATIAYAAFIFYLSIRPSYQPPLFPYSDKVIHAGIYGVLAYLVFWSLHGARGLPGSGLGMISVVMAAIYGALIEIFQMYVPTRSADIFDALFNAAGAIIGAYTYVVITKIRLRRAMR